MTGFLIALLSGALMSVQGVFNTQVTKTTGMWVSNAGCSSVHSCYVPLHGLSPEEILLAHCGKWNPDMYYLEA